MNQNPNPNPEVVAAVAQPEEATARKSRLGRGLNSLLGIPSHAESAEAMAVDAKGEFQPIDVAAIDRNPHQPRREFEPAAIQELSESISVHGVLQPLLVRRVGDRFQLIAGERRLIASKKAGLTSVPCRIVEMDERCVTEVAIVENLQRADLNELEKAQAFQEYLDKYSVTIEELAKKLGKDRSTISNSLRLLELPEFVKTAIRSGKISAGHGRTLLPLDTEADQIAMCQRIQSEGLSVRTTEEAVRELLSEREEADVVPFKGSEQAGGKKKVSMSKHLQSLQEQLRESLSLKVEIKLKTRDSGKVIITFGSNDEFERIVQQVKKVA